MKFPSGNSILFNLLKAVTVVIGVAVFFYLGDLLGQLYGSIVN